MEINLFDTDFLFEFIHLNDDAVKFMDLYSAIIFSSAVTAMELVKACPNKVVLNCLLTKHFPQVVFIAVEKEISEMASSLVEKFHLSHNISINDAFVAATALHYNLPLATCNIAGFQYIPNLKLVKHNVKPRRRGGTLFTF